MLLWQTLKNVRIRQVRLQQKTDVFLHSRCAWIAIDSFVSVLVNLCRWHGSPLLFPLRFSRTVIFRVQPSLPSFIPSCPVPLHNPAHGVWESGVSSPEHICDIWSQSKLSGHSGGTLATSLFLFVYVTRMQAWLPEFEIYMPILATTSLMISASSFWAQHHFKLKTDYVSLIWMIVRGAFNKFQDYFFYTTVASRKTFLSLFNNTCTSLQVDAPSHRFISRNDVHGTEISVSDAEVQNACCWTSWLSIDLSPSRFLQWSKEMKFTWHKVLTVTRMWQQFSTNCSNFLHGLKSLKWQIVIMLQHDTLSQRIWSFSVMTHADTSIF